MSRPEAYKHPFMEEFGVTEEVGGARIGRKIPFCLIRGRDLVQIYFLPLYDSFSCYL